MILETKKMFELQQILQDRIVSEHGVSIEETKDLRILALLVEIGECANETRSFKYWSNKGSSAKDVVLEEFVDGIHFLLAIGIDHGITPDFIEFEKGNTTDISTQFLNVYAAVINMRQYIAYDKDAYVNTFACYLQLLPLLGIDSEEVYDAYVLKNKENHHRQDTDY